MALRLFKSKNLKKKQKLFNEKYIALLFFEIFELSAQVEVVKNNTELLKYLSKESLPVELGGLVHHDHAGWIQQCIISSQRYSLTSKKLI